VIVNVPRTVAVELGPLKPVADAVIVELPPFRPFTRGCVAGVVAWKTMKTDGVTVATEGVAAIERDGDTAHGAGNARLTGNGTD
jgi:hypothetical protein